MKRVIPLKVIMVYLQPHIIGPVAVCRVGTCVFWDESIGDHRSYYNAERLRAHKINTNSRDIFSKNPKTHLESAQGGEKKSSCSSARTPE